MKTEDYFSPELTVIQVEMTGFLCVSLINQLSFTEAIIEDTPEDYVVME